MEHESRKGLGLESLHDGRRALNHRFQKDRSAPWGDNTCRDFAYRQVALHEECNDPRRAVDIGRGTAVCAGWMVDRIVSEQRLHSALVAIA